MQRFTSQFLLSFLDLQHTVEEILVEDDRVAVRFSAQGTHLGPWLDFKPTGKAIHSTGVTWARIADEKMIEHHTRSDFGGLHHHGVFKKGFRSLHPRAIRFCREV